MMAQAKAATWPPERMYLWSGGKLPSSNFVTEEENAARNRGREKARGRLLQTGRPLLKLQKLIAPEATPIPPCYTQACKRNLAAFLPI